MSDDWVTYEEISHKGSFALKGQWLVERSGALSKALHSHSPTASAQKIIFHAQDLEDIDTSGAWILIRYIRNLQAQGIEVRFNGLKENHQSILDIIGKIEAQPSEQGRSSSFIGGIFIAIGQATADFWDSMVQLITFFGILCVTLGRSLLQPSRLRIRSIVAHINEICIKAVPIIALMAFLISIVLGYQGANQLQNFGATIFTIDLVAISVLREMGVLITAIMVAGRSGSAFAAQIGVMQVNEEVDAMRTIGLDPFELLVLPRILAILIALPALTFIADVVGLLGTWFIAAVLIDISTIQFLGRLQSAVDVSAFWVGLAKAPIFALLIGMVGCLQGLNVKRSAAEVGARTTMAVVQAIFLVILSDALFSVVLTWWGI